MGICSLLTAIEAVIVDCNRCWSLSKYWKFYWTDNFYSWILCNGIKIKVSLGWKCIKVGPICHFCNLNVPELEFLWNSRLIWIAAIVKIRCSIQGEICPWDGWFIQQTWMGRNHQWIQFFSWQKLLQTAKLVQVMKQCFSFTFAWFECTLPIVNVELAQRTFLLPIMSFWLFVATQLRSCPWVSGSCRENERNVKTKWLLLLLARHWSYWYLPS